MHDCESRRSLPFWNSPGAVLFSSGKKCLFLWRKLALLECNSKCSLGQHKSLALAWEYCKYAIRHVCAYSGVREAGTRTCTGLSMLLSGPVPAKGGRWGGKGKLKADQVWGGVGWWADQPKEVLLDLPWPFGFALVISDSAGTNLSSLIREAATAAE